MSPASPWIVRWSPLLQPQTTVLDVACGSGRHLQWFAQGGHVVTNYLWRPLFATLVQSVAPGGVFLYETFASSNETLGRPSRPDFLLQPGELLAVCKDLHIVACENGFLQNPDRVVQRIAAIRPLPSTHTPAPPQHPAL